MHVHLSEGVFGSDGVLRVELRSRLLVVTQAQYIALVPDAALALDPRVPDGRRIHLRR